MTFESMKKSISIIVAIASNHAIGKNNRLLWHIPGDLKRFKKLTVGHAVIMGKKTFESLPNKPLPDRTNIVLTDVPGEAMAGCVMAYSAEEALAKCPEGESFVIGGGSVYRQFLPLADKLYITRVHKEFEADTFFPDIPEEEWILLSTEDPADVGNQNFKYTYEIYVRKTKK
jgi:dihydrofolate reductase